MDAVDEALAYFTKNRLPLNDVAEKFGVARSTLGHRLNVNGNASRLGYLPKFDPRELRSRDCSVGL